MATLTPWTAHSIGTWLSAGLLVACSDGASSDLALTAQLRLTDAQFIQGALPAVETETEVTSVSLPTNTIWPGESNKPLRGSLGPDAVAVAVALSDDLGYWIVPAGVPDSASPLDPTFRTTAAFSRDLAPGDYALELHAVDGRSRFGPASTTILTALSEPPSALIEGELLVTLDWDTLADLDLHVIDPFGNEVYHGATHSVDPFAPGAALSSSSDGVLLNDAHASCARSGQSRETVVWKSAPPEGRYLVRIDATSLCDEPFAHWKVKATLRGDSLGAASGTALDTDTWGNHDRGAGLTALDWELP